MEDKLVNYSLYDVNGNRYDARVTQREADLFEKYPGKMYAKVLQLEKEGKQPSKPAAKQRTKRKATKKKKDELPSPIHFDPVMSSTLNPANTAAPQESENLFQSPVSKKVREDGNLFQSPVLEKVGEAGVADSKSTARRRQLFYDISQSNGALTPGIPSDQTLADETPVFDDAGASTKERNSSPQRMLNTSFEILNVGNEDVYLHQTLVGPEPNSKHPKQQSMNESAQSYLNANQSLVSKSSMSFSNKVTVLELEEGFQNSVLLYFINFAMKDLCDGKPAVHCRALDRTSAEVEFTSVQDAATSCLLDISYGHKKIKLEQKINHTNKVKINGLEEDFDPSVLLFLLNMSLTNSPALKCDRTGSTSAIVEFTSGDAAEACCKLNLKYGRRDKVTIEPCSMPDGQPRDEVNEDQTVDLEQNKNHNSVVYFDSESDEEPLSDSLMQDSDIVKVSGMDFTTADQDGFLSLLQSRMQEAGFISEGEKLVNSVTVSSDSALILKLRSSEEATLACLLKKVNYLGNKLEIKKYAVDVDNKVISVNESEASSSQMDVYDGEGYFIYAQMLIRYRNKFPKTGSHEAIFASIKKKLQKRGVLCSVADLRIKRDRMKSLFNKKKKYGLVNHEFYLPGTVIFENADLSSVKGTSYDPAFLGDENSSDEEGSGGLESEDSSGSDNSSDVDADDRLKFSKVATWSIDAAIDLVETLIDNADDFYKPKRRKRFWLKIQRSMTKKKRYYNWKQCQSKAEGLKAALKDRNEGRTGDAGPMFRQQNQKLNTLMDKVAELHHGSVAINPKVVLAAGLKPHEKRSNESTSDCAEINRSGRARPNAMSKKQRLPSKAELEVRRVAALELKAKALYRWSKKRCPSLTDVEEGEDEEKDEDDY